MSCTFWLSAACSDSLMRSASMMPSGTPSSTTTISTAETVDLIIRRRIEPPWPWTVPRWSDSGARRRAFQSAALEPEADPPHGGDEPGVRGVVAELLTQPGDVHVERLGRGPPGSVPDFAHQLFPGYHPAGVAHQDAQQVELLGGQVELLVAEEGAVRLHVDTHA